MPSDLPIPREIPGVGEQEMPEGIYNAGSRKSVRNRKAEVELRLLGKDEALLQLMSQKYGRALIYDLLNVGGLWASGANPAADRSELLWFKEGARQMAIEINAAAWRSAPQAYKLMLDENNAPP
jgi:hypothetical protein